VGLVARLGVTVNSEEFLVGIVRLRTKATEFSFF
jgi:hypothetical protein